MNISAISSAFVNPISLPGQNDPAAAPVTPQPQDVVNLNCLPDMTDEEIDGLMNETIAMIGADSVSALSVHSGLDPNRVFSLLGLA